VLRFVSDAWLSARRPPVFRRCLIIALVVGTLLSLVNQGDAIVAGHLDRVGLLRMIANYVIPFVVSNLGALASLESRPGPPDARRRRSGQGGTRRDT
jgi:hypothetical protein